MDSYTFVRPDDNLTWLLPSEYSNSIGSFEAGHSLQVSKSCNPKFVYGDVQSWHLDCDDLKYRGACDLKVTELIFHGHSNTNGHLETFLQCPQCGCGSEGAANLNDLYAAEQNGLRKVSDVASTIFNEPLQ